MALAVWREMARWQAGASTLSPKVVSELKLAQNALRALGAPILDAVRRRHRDGPVTSFFARLVPTQPHGKISENRITSERFSLR